MSIILKSDINDPTLPMSGTLMTQIKAKPSLVSWHRMTPDNLNPGTTQQGAPIVDVLNLRGTGGTFSNFTTDASRPQYANGRLNGRPGIRFDGVDDFLVQFNSSTSRGSSAPRGRWLCSFRLTRAWPSKRLWRPTTAAQ
jgi:hypothetical protein